MNTKVGRVEVYATVGFLGLAAFALGFAAEVTKVKEISRDSYGTCIYPRSPASVLAYVGAFSTFIAVIIVSVATRCACCSRISSNDDTDFIARYVGILSLGFMWIATYLSIHNLLLGALVNQKHANTSSKCFTVRFAIFAKGGIWGLMACASGLFSYGFMSKNSQNTPVETGIALGTPSSKR